MNRNERSADFARRAYYWKHHRKRYQRYVELHWLPCQECGGYGGETDVILDDGTGPWEECGFCEGTGKVTRWVRGIWLRWKAEEKRKQAAKQRVA